MPRKKKAAPGQEAALQVQQRTEILADAAGERKQDFGRCPCGAEISAVHTIGCKTCGAWARWRSAFRVAANALRGPQ